jgi:glycosyltransferase involved in cell wall biosynthesis
VDCSLTVLLPVEDVQADLAASVVRLLEVLSELTDRLEIIIVDDGSTDATIEVADELASRYPQVRAIRNTTSHGRARAIQRGIDSARGDVILLIDDDCCLPVDEVGLLWRAAQEHEIVLGRLARQTASDSTRLRRLDRAAEGGYQMLSRRAACHLRNCVGHQATLRAELARTSARWHEIEVGPRSSCNRTLALDCRPSRPNYLRAIRQLALGE